MISRGRRGWSTPRSVRSASTRWTAWRSGRRVTLPRAAMTGARRDLIQRILLDACTPGPDLVVELGSGGGITCSTSTSGAGRGCRTAPSSRPQSGRGPAPRSWLALDPGARPDHRSLRLRAPGLRRAAARNAHVLVFTVHSIEQVTSCPARRSRACSISAASVTGVHFEPVGWQILDEPDAAVARVRAAPALQPQPVGTPPGARSRRRARRSTTVVPDLFGDKYKNPGTLIVWHTPRAADEDHALPVPRHGLLRHLREGALERRRARSASRTSSRSASWSSGRSSGSAGTTAAAADLGDRAVLRARLPAHLPDRLLSTRHGRRLRAVREGDAQVGDPHPLPRRRHRVPVSALANASTGRRSARSLPGSSSTPSTACSSWSRPRAGAISTTPCSRR